MNPITFTYDWGMVTDLARRNIARICGQLGVENILASADIKKKRNNIRKNIEAWMRAPDLGIIPLFMAGDKYFFTEVNELKRETGIQLNIWATNRYENTDFKSGFCGIEPVFDKRAIDALTFRDRIRMPLYYLSRYSRNPSYLNSSLTDTLGAYWAYYFAPRRDICLMFIDYIDWDEERVENCLVNEYGWEVSKSTNSTWRIGDGTAAFYNYIYNTAAGFSEFDTFRSNQIRDGKMSRKEALKRIEIENRPNFESLVWYCDTIDLDYEALVAVVDSMPKRYVV